jgi:hypothetical protein
VQAAQGILRAALSQVSERVAALNPTEWARQRSQEAEGDSGGVPAAADMQQCRRRAADKCLRVLPNLQELLAQFSLATTQQMTAPASGSHPGEAGRLTQLMTAALEEFEVGERHSFFCGGGGFGSGGGHTRWHRRTAGSAGAAVAAAAEMDDDATPARGSCLTAAQARIRCSDRARVDVLEARCGDCPPESLRRCAWEATARTATMTVTLSSCVSNQPLH